MGREWLDGEWLGAAFRSRRRHSGHSLPAERDPGRQPEEHRRLSDAQFRQRQSDLRRREAERQSRRSFRQYPRPLRRRDPDHRTRAWSAGQLHYALPTGPGSAAARRPTGGRDVTAEWRLLAHCGAICATAAIRWERDESGHAEHGEHQQQPVASEPEPEVRYRTASRGSLRRVEGNDVAGSGEHPQLADGQLRFEQRHRHVQRRQPDI